jgi:hypothetical protein
MTSTPTIAIRFAAPTEASAVRRLAALDDAPVPGGRVLIAVVGGEPLAAMSLDDGRVVADPFRRTADVVALVRLRASLLAGRASSAGRDRGTGSMLGRLRPRSQARLHVPGL